MSFQEIEQQIVESSKWNDCMKAIDSFTVEDTGSEYFMCEHGKGHALRVANYTQRFLEDLGEPEDIVAIGRIACLLHDISLENGEKTNHSSRSAIQAQEY